jgi:hypothetical protein
MSGKDGRDSAKGFKWHTLQCMPLDLVYGFIQRKVCNLTKERMG